MATIVITILVEEAMGGMTPAVFEDLDLNPFNGLLSLLGLVVVLLSSSSNVAVFEHESSAEQCCCMDL